MGVFGRSLRFAFRFDDMADRLYDSPKRWAIQGPPWTGGKIDLLSVDGEDVFALRHAVHCETKLCRLEQNTVRQLAAQGEPGGRAGYHQRVASTVQFLAGHDDHRMWTRRAEVGHVDLARPDHGISSRRPAALRKAVEWMTCSRRSSSNNARIASYSSS